MTYAAWWVPFLAGLLSHWLWTRRNSPWLDDPEDECLSAMRRIAERREG